MKNFHFPQIFTPIIGDLFPENGHHSRYLKDERQTITLGGLKTLRQLSLAGQSQINGCKSKTSKYLTSPRNLNQLNLKADRVNIKCRPNSNINKNNGSIKNCPLNTFSKTNKNIDKNPYKNDRAQRKTIVRFQNDGQLINYSCSQFSSYSSDNFSVHLYQSQQNSDTKNRKIGQNIRLVKVLTECDDEVQDKNRNKNRVSTQIQDKQQFVKTQNIRVREKIHMNFNKKAKKNAVNLGDKFDSNKNEGKNPKTVQLKQNNSNNKQNHYKNTAQIQKQLQYQQDSNTTNNDDNANRHNEQILTSIHTIDIDMLYSQKNISQSNSIKHFRMPKTTAKSTHVISEQNVVQIQRRATKRKTYLKRINTFHVLGHESDSDRNIGSSILINRKQSRKLAVKSSIYQYQGDHSASSDNLKTSRKLRMTNKKVTFVQHFGQKVEKEDEEPKIIARCNTKKKCVVKLKNRTSIDMESTLNILEEASEGKKNFKTFVLNKTKQKPRKKSNTGLVALDQNVYNELNYFFVRMMGVKQLQQQQIGNFRFPQPIYMSTENGVDPKNRQRIQRVARQQAMIDFGVKMARGYDLKQIPA